MKRQRSSFVRLRTPDTLVILHLDVDVSGDKPADEQDGERRVRGGGADWRRWGRARSSSSDAWQSSGVAASQSKRYWPKRVHGRESTRFTKLESGVDSRQQRPHAQSRSRVHRMAQTNPLFEPEVRTTRFPLQTTPLTSSSLQPLAEAPYPARRRRRARACLGLEAEPEHSRREDLCCAWCVASCGISSPSGPSTGDADCSIRRRTGNGGMTTGKKTVSVAVAAEDFKGLLDFAVKNEVSTCTPPSSKCR